MNYPGDTYRGKVADRLTYADWYDLVRQVEGTVRPSRPTHARPCGRLRPWRRTSVGSR